MTAPTTSKICVASYNVHSCAGVDGHRDAARIGRVVKSLGAPVVALQEVGLGPDGRTPGEPPQVDVIAGVADMQAVPLVTFEKRDVPYGSALLTTLPIRATRRIELSVDRCEPRAALDVELHASGVVLRVIATHLGLRPAERRFQVKKLLEHVSHDDQSVTVLVGDINEWFVYGRPLRWLHARFGRGPHVRSWPSFLPVFALDRVWVHPRRVFSGLVAARTEESRVASDHLPVVATLEW